MPERSLNYTGQDTRPHSKCPEKVPSHSTKQDSSASHPPHSQDPSTEAPAGLRAWARCHGSQPLPAPPLVGICPLLKRPVVSVSPSQSLHPARTHSTALKTVTHTASVMLRGQAGGGGLRAGTHWNIHSPVAAEAAVGVAHRTTDPLGMKQPLRASGAVASPPFFK